MSVWRTTEQNFGKSKQVWAFQEERLRCRQYTSGGDTENSNNTWHWCCHSTTATTTTATSSRDHDAGTSRPPPLQPGRVRPVPVQPSLRGSQGCTDRIMLTIIMTFAIMTKRNNECDTANFHSQYVIVVFKPGRWWALHCAKLRSKVCVQRYIAA